MTRFRSLGLRPHILTSNFPQIFVKVHMVIPGLGSRQIFFRLGLRLLVYFQAASAPAPYFFQAAPAPRAKTMRLRLLLFVKFGEIFFSPQTTNVKLQEIYVKHLN